MTASARNTGTGRPWPQVLGLAFGAIYLLVGIIGFFITGFDNFAGNEQHEMLLFFMINPLHNIVHILIGVLGLALSRRMARSMGGDLRVDHAVADGAATITGSFPPLGSRQYSLPRIMIGAWSCSANHSTTSFGNRRSNSSRSASLSVPI